MSVRLPYAKEETANQSLYEDELNDIFYIHKSSIASH